MSPALCLTILFLRVASAAPIYDSRFHARWHNWKMKHERTYILVGNMETVQSDPHENGPCYGEFMTMSEEEQREAIWQKNVIQLHNEKHLGGKHDFTMEINTSGDMNTEELSVLKNRFQNQKHRDEIFQKPQQKEIPRSVGWKEKGCRSPVKDQEGPSMYDHWCSAVNCAGYVFIPRNEESLKRAVAMEGLISASIGGLWGSFRFYKRGNYYDPNFNKTLTHTVLMISYGFEGTESDNKIYWLVKNRQKLPNRSTSEHQNELPACN